MILVWMVGASERSRFPFSVASSIAQVSLMKALTTAVQTYMFTRAERWWHAVRYRVLNTWFRADHLTRSLCWIAFFISYFCFFPPTEASSGLLFIIFFQTFIFPPLGRWHFFSQVCSIAIACHLVDTLGFRASFLYPMLHDISDSKLRPTFRLRFVLFGFRGVRIAHRPSPRFKLRRLGLLQCV